MVTGTSPGTPSPYGTGGSGGGGRVQQTRPTPNDNNVQAKNSAPVTVQSAINAPAGTLSATSARTGQVFITNQGAPDIGARQQESAQFAAQVRQPGGYIVPSSSGGRFGSALPGSSQTVQEQTYLQQALQADLAGQGTLAEMLRGKAAQAARISSDKELRQREAAFASNQAQGQFQAGVASNRPPNILETAAERRGTPFNTVEGVTTTTLPSARLLPVIALSEKAAAKVASQGGGVTVYGQGITPEGRPYIGPVRTFSQPRLSPGAEALLLAKARSEYQGVSPSKTAQTESPAGVNISGYSPKQQAAIQDYLTGKTQRTGEGQGIIPSSIALLGTTFTKAQLDIINGVGYDQKTGQKLLAYTSEERKNLAIDIRNKSSQGINQYDVGSVIAPGIAKPFFTGRGTKEFNPKTFTPSPFTIERTLRPNGGFKEGSSSASQVQSSGLSLPSQIGTTQAIVAQIVQTENQKQAEYIDSLRQSAADYGHLFGIHNLESPEEGSLGLAYTPDTAPFSFGSPKTFFVVAKTGYVVKQGIKEVENLGRQIQQSNSIVTKFLPVNADVIIGVARIGESAVQSPLKTTLDFYVFSKAFRAAEAVLGVAGYGARGVVKVIPKVGEPLVKFIDKTRASFGFKVATNVAVPAAFTAAGVAQRYKSGDVRPGENVFNIATQEAVVPFLIQGLSAGLSPAQSKTRVKIGDKNVKVVETKTTEVTGVSRAQFGNIVTTTGEGVLLDIPNIKAGQETNLVAKTRTQTTTQEVIKQKVSFKTKNPLEYLQRLEAQGKIKLNIFTEGTLKTELIKKNGFLVPKDLEQSNSLGMVLVGKNNKVIVNLYPERAKVFKGKGLFNLEFFDSTKFADAIKHEAIHVEDVLKTGGYSNEQLTRLRQLFPKEFTITENIEVSKSTRIGKPVENAQVLKVLQKAQGDINEKMAILEGNIKAAKAVPKYENVIPIPEKQLSYPGQFIVEGKPIKVGQQALTLLSNEQGQKLLFTEEVLRGVPNKEGLVPQTRTKGFGRIKEVINDLGQKIQQTIRKTNQETTTLVPKNRNVFTSKEFQNAFTGPLGPATGLDFSATKEIAELTAPLIYGGKNVFEAITGKNFKAGTFKGGKATINYGESIGVFRKSGDAENPRLDFSVTKSKPREGKFTSSAFGVGPRTPPPERVSVKLPDLKKLDVATTQKQDLSKEVGAALGLSDASLKKAAERVLNRIEVTERTIVKPVFETKRSLNFRPLIAGTQVLRQIQQPSLRQVPRQDLRAIPRTLPQLDIIPRLSIIPEVRVLTEQIPETRIDTRTEQIIERITGIPTPNINVPPTPPPPTPVFGLLRGHEPGFGPQPVRSRYDFSGTKLYKGLTSKQYAAVIGKNLKIPGARKKFGLR